VTVKKNAYGIAFVLLLLLSAAAGLMRVVPAKAFFERPPPAPHIIIAADGTVHNTQNIQQDGNIYYLTGDIEGYSLIVERSNIILDGKGYLLNCTGYISHAILLTSVTNVTVKNFQIIGGNSAVALMYGSSHCTIENITSNKDIFFSQSNLNTVSKCNAGINLWLASSNNTIKKNNITSICNAGNSNSYYSAGVFNCFYLNNIMLDKYPLLSIDTFWDNGSVGNYWSNYTARYPNTSEIGFTGIGNTPYDVQRSDYAIKTFPNVTNIDHYPLMYPYDIENDAIAFPTPEPQPEQEPFPTVPVAVASGAVVISVALIVYFKKRKR
jgi:hypothetical protein